MNDRPRPPAPPGSRSTGRVATVLRHAPELFMHVDVHGDGGTARYSTRLASIEQAQLAYLELRAALDAGACRMGEGMIIGAAGVVVARISWNGRVWAGPDWRPGDVPILEAPEAGS